MSYLQKEGGAKAVISLNFKYSFCCPLSDLHMSGVLPRPSLPRGTERLLGVDGQALDVLGVAPAGVGTRLYRDAAMNARDMGMKLHFAVKFSSASAAPRIRHLKLA